MDQRSRPRAEVCFGGGIRARGCDGAAVVFGDTVARSPRGHRGARGTLRRDRRGAGRLGRGGVGAERSAWDGIWHDGGGERGRRFFVERDGWIFVERVFCAGGVWNVGDFVFGWRDYGFAIEALKNRSAYAALFTAPQGNNPRCLRLVFAIEH